MGLSLGFHIVLASIGMVMPFLMCLAHRRWLRTGEEKAYRLTRLWARGVAIFFATGAVSGTALSFELGVLWPTFMEHAGPIIGMPFSLEGAAFFVEAIALGIYLYGWGRLPARWHWWSGFLVGVAGVASGALVISANGWMNSPTGFIWEDGAATHVDPWAAMLNPAWGSEALHMTVAAFEAVGFAVAGIHLYLGRGRDSDPMHRVGFRTALAVASVAAIAQLFVGHEAAQGVARRQPAKLAAMEAVFTTQTHAPLLIGGFPDVDTGEVHGAIEVPGGLSLLAFGDPEAEVKGLDQVPREDWPPVATVHIAFQVMVAIGTWLALLGIFSLVALIRRADWLNNPWFVRCVIASVPLGFVAIEAGWIVTEVGRQPWIITGIMRTRDAVSPVPGQVWHLIFFVTLYALIGVSALWMWSRQIRYSSQIGAPSKELLEWARGERS